MVDKRVIHHTESSDIAERVSLDGGIERTEYRSSETYIECVLRPNRSGERQGFLRKLRVSEVWAYICKLAALFVERIFYN